MNIYDTKTFTLKGDYDIKPITLKGGYDWHFSYPAPKNVLITGGTGSLGSKLVEHYHKTHKVTVLSRDPHKQQALKQRFPHIRFILGDIRDKTVVTKALQGAEIVIHTAALKILAPGEQHVSEYLDVNVRGTQVLLECLTSQTFVFTSSDKAVDPINVYGMSKLMAEQLCHEARREGKHVAIVRYGNVLDSEGSVYNIWRQGVIRGAVLQVRTPAPTRFVLSLKDAVGIVNAVIVTQNHRYDYAPVYVPQGLKAVDIQALADALSDNQQALPLLKGEKQHEVLVARNEYTLEDPINGLLEVRKDTFVHDSGSYVSNGVPLMPADEVIRVLETGGQFWNHDS